MVVDLAVAQEREEALDLLIRNSLTKAYAIDISDGHQHCRVVRHDAQVKEAASGA